MEQEPSNPIGSPTPLGQTVSSVQKANVPLKGSRRLKTPANARERKRHQARLRQSRRRVRLKQEGKLVTVHLSSRVVSMLENLQTLGFGSSQAETVGRSIEVCYEEWAARYEPLNRLIKGYWPRIRPLLPYSAYFRSPGMVVTIKGKQVRSDEWFELFPVWKDIETKAKLMGVKDTVGLCDRLVKHAETMSRQLGK